MAKAKASGVGGAAITYDDLQTIHQNFHEMISLHPTLGPSYTDLVNGKTPDFESMSLDSSFFPATLQHTHQTQMHPPPAVNGRHSQDSIAAPAEGSQPSDKDPHHAQPVYDPNPDFPLSNVSQYSLQPSMTQFNLSFTESEPPLAISQPMAQPVLPPSTFGGGQMPLAAAGSQNGHWKDKLLQDIYQELMTVSEAEPCIASAWSWLPLLFFFINTNCDRLVVRRWCTIYCARYDGSCCCIKF
jgi:hypothetical protein